MYLCNFESCDELPFNFDVVVYYETHKWLSFLYVNHNGFSVFMCAFVQIDELMWLNLDVLHEQLHKGFLGVWYLTRKWIRHSWLQGPCLVMWNNMANNKSVILRNAPLTLPMFLSCLDLIFLIFCYVLMVGVIQCFLFKNIREPGNKRIYCIVWYRAIEDITFIKLHPL